MITNVDPVKIEEYELYLRKIEADKKELEEIRQMCKKYGYQTPKEFFDKFDQYNETIKKELNVDLIEYIKITIDKFLQSNYKSFIIGGIGEYHLEQLLLLKKCLVCKVKDMDSKKRFDYEATLPSLNAINTVTIEVKVAKPTYTFDTGFRDGVVVNEETQYKSNRRHRKNQQCDWFAVCLKNLSRNSWKDFVFIKYEDLPYNTLEKANNEEFLLNNVNLFQLPRLYTLEEFINYYN